MEENKLFSYIDNVELSKSMKENLIKREVPFREAKTLHRKGFAVLGGMAAVLCGAVVGGYVFIMNGGLLPPPMDEGSVWGSNPPITTTPPPLTTMPDEVTASPARDFVYAPSPVVTQNTRSFWYSDLYGHEYVLNIFDSLEYHTEFAAFAERSPVLDDWQTNSIYDVEQFVFDFLEYTAMPPVLIPEPTNHAFTKEQIRAREIDSTILALGVARAFVMGNADELNSRFINNTPGLFDFTKGMGFSEFSLIGTEFDPINNEHLHYFSVIENNTWENIFTSEQKWILRTDGHQIQQFAPAGRYITRVNPRWEQFYDEEDYDKLIRFCYFYSTLYLLQPEDTYPWNLRGLFAFMHLGYEYTNFNEHGMGYFTIEEFIAHIDYVYGKEITLDEIIDSRMFWEDEDGEIYATLHAGGYSPTRAELSEIIERDGRVILIMNFYGDAGYMFLAETLIFELTAGNHGWQLTSVETVGDNPDVNVAFIHY